MAECRCNENPCKCEQCTTPNCDEFGDCICGECKFCPNHCLCVRCEGCLEPSIKTCQHCAKCGECCKCVQCPNCGGRTEKNLLDIECGLCRNCCGCRSLAHSGLPAVGADTHLPPFFWNPEGKGYATDQTTPDIPDHPKTAKFKFPSTRYVSAEIEVASSSRKRSKELAANIKKLQCNIMHDGSLPETGYEITTAPAYGITYVKEILHLCDSLKQAEAKISDECGLHVHVDCRDFKWLPDLRNLLRIYSYVEDAMFKIVPPTRQKPKNGGRSYCSPCGNKFKTLYDGDDISAFRTSLNKIVYKSEDEAATFKSRKRHDSRYNALNVHSWFFRFTMEFRHHQGTLNAEKIINWTMLCCSLVDYAKNHSEADVIAQLGKLKPYDALVVVIGDNMGLRRWVESRIDHFAAKAEDDDNVFFDMVGS